MNKELCTRKKKKKKREGKGKRGQGSKPPTKKVFVDAVGIKGRKKKN